MLCFSNQPGVDVDAHVPDVDRGQPVGALLEDELLGPGRQGGFVGREHPLLQGPGGERVVDPEGEVAGRVVPGQRQLGRQRAGITGGARHQVDPALALEGGDQLLGQVKDSWLTSTTLPPTSSEPSGASGLGSVALDPEPPIVLQPAVRTSAEASEIVRRQRNMRFDSLSPVLTGSGSEGLRTNRTLSTEVLPCLVATAYAAAPATTARARR
jgi:hypothetical protein